MKINRQEQINKAWNTEIPVAGKASEMYRTDLVATGFFIYL
jgi:hypothetical protein